MRSPRVHIARALAVTLVAATSLAAQSAAHIGVRGVQHAGPGGYANPRGVSAQLDVTARERIDVRFTGGVASGSRRRFDSCGGPSFNCVPVEVELDTRLTSFGFALPVRLSRPGTLDVRLVPGLDGHSLDGSILLGLSLGLETRYRRSLASRLEFVAAADVSRTNDISIVADAPSYDGALTRFSVGVRYRFYARR